MISHYGSSLPLEEVVRVFAIPERWPDIKSVWDFIPGQPAPVVYRDPDTGERCLSLWKWGMVPSWTRDLASMRRPISVRSEMVAQSGMIADTFRSRRCLVPAKLYYALRTRGGIELSLAMLPADGDLLPLGGIWEEWTSPEGQALRTFALMTVLADQEAAGVGRHVPVVIERQDWKRWLGEEDGDVLNLLRPAAEGTLRMHPHPPGVIAGLR